MAELASYELLMRGAAAGLCVVLSATWLVRGQGWTSRLGALFLLGILGYALISSPTTRDMLGPAAPMLKLVAIFTSVFFWWFILALFDDESHWRLWFWIPAIILTATLPFRIGNISETQEIIINIIHQFVVVPILLHAIVLAIRDFSTDLIEPRRRFRIAIATLIPAMGILIVINEVNADVLGGSISQTTLIWHAGILLALITLFTLWVLVPRDELFEKARVGAAPTTEQHKASLAPEDRIELDRLSALMTEGLTVGSLAEKVRVPEHRLRKLINQGLGYRNFAAYLNNHRIEEAKAILADPEKAREQIIQVALELGYASVSPFNRAFKLETGLTPSEFRKESLANFEKD